MSKIDSGANRLVLDFSGLDYISSAGLRVLLMAAKRVQAEKGAMALFGMKEHVKDVFEISGFLPVLTVVDSAEAAIEAASAQ
jgi:anti-anti-sigma factor